jgi:hypothetical protein
MPTIQTAAVNPVFTSAERLANLLDNQVRFGAWGFGLDAFLDLLPISGDLIVLALSLYLVWLGFRLGASREDITRMLVNVGVAFAVGLIPVIGDVAYLLLRPNLRNLEILRRYA